MAPHQTRSPHSNGEARATARPLPRLRQLTTTVILGTGTHHLSRFRQKRQADRPVLSLRSLSIEVGVGNRRFPRCPVGRHWSTVTRLGPATADPAELAKAAGHHDIRISGPRRAVPASRPRRRTLGVRRGLAED